MNYALQGTIGRRSRLEITEQEFWELKHANKVLTQLTLLSVFIPSS
jgi:hypothetical protein